MLHSIRTRILEGRRAGRKTQLFGERSSQLELLLCFWSFPNSISPSAIFTAWICPNWAYSSTWLACCLSRLLVRLFLLVIRKRWVIMYLTEIYMLRGCERYTYECNCLIVWECCVFRCLVSCGIIVLSRWMSRSTSSFFFSYPKQTQSPHTFHSDCTLDIVIFRLMPDSNVPSRFWLSNQYFGKSHPFMLSLATDSRADRGTLQRHSIKREGCSQ